MHAAGHVEWHFRLASDQAINPPGGTLWMRGSLADAACIAPHHGPHRVLVSSLLQVLRQGRHAGAPLHGL